MAKLTKREIRAAVRATLLAQDYEENFIDCRSVTDFETKITAPMRGYAGLCRKTQVGIERFKRLRKKLWEMLEEKE